MTAGLKKWLNFTVAIAFFGVLFVYPFDSSDMPEWRVRVVDENGQPVPGARVREVWNSPIVLHASDISVFDVTDRDGQVTFPQGFVRASAARRAMTYILSSKTERSSPRVVACWQDNTGQIIWEGMRGDPPHQVTLHRGSCL